MNHGLSGGRTTQGNAAATEARRAHILTVVVPMSDVERFLAKGYTATVFNGHDVTFISRFADEKSAMRRARTLSHPCTVEEA